MPVQGTTNLTTATQWKTLLNRELKCSNPVIESLKLHQEIDAVNKLYEFEDKDWDTISKQCLRPPTGDPVIIPVITLKRLKASSKAAKYYTWCGYTMTVQNMKWSIIEKISEVLKSYEQKFDSSLEAKYAKLRGNGRMPMWLEKNKSEIDTSIGIRKIPLSYVVRPDDVPGPPPPLLQNLPYSAEHPSVELTLIHRATHDHPLIDEDKKLLFTKLVDAWTGTEVDNLLTGAMREEKDGRSFWIQATKEFAGKDKWEQMIKDAELTFTTDKWTGTGTKHTLNAHANKHRMAYSRIEVASRQDSVDYTLPSMPQRVSYFLDSITANDPDLLTRIQIAKSDMAAGGKATNLDACIEFLLPVDPVFLLQRKGGPKSDTIRGGGKPRSNVTVSSATIKSGKGKTGVDFRWHPPDEYHKLSQEQKDEHSAWMRTTAGKETFKAQRKAATSKKRNGSGAGNSYQRSNKKFKSAVSAAVAEAMTKVNEKETEANEFAASLVDALKTTQITSNTYSARGMPMPNVISSDAEDAIKKTISSLFQNKKK